MEEKGKTGPGKGEDRGVGSSFGADSAPYLMATEYPWLAPWEESPKKQKVLCVGGSGDVPFFFSRMGAARVTAVDVSRPACFLMQLKAACLRELAWEEFLAFFLADIPRAETFLRSRGVSPHLPVAEREHLYRRVQGHGHESSRRFWKERFENVLSGNSPLAGKSPFEKFLHATDLFGLHLIPYLNDPAVYAQWARGAENVRVLNLSLDAALDRCAEEWNLIYASNVFEYLEMDLALKGREDEFRTYVFEFSRKAGRTLKEGGVLCWYAYERGDSPAFQERVKGLAGIFGKEWTLSAHGLAYRFSNLSGSRFRNTLICFRRDGAP